MVWSTIHCLPTGLFNSGYFSFVGQGSKANPADLELTINAFGSSTKLAARILSDPEFLFLRSFVFQRLGRHSSVPFSLKRSAYDYRLLSSAFYLNGIPKSDSIFFASPSVLALVTKVMFIPC